MICLLSVAEMAMIHENSCACVGSQLDLFTVPGTQTSQEKNTYVPHYPISSAANVALEFDVKPSSMYTDLGDTRLYLRCKVVKKSDGSELDQAANISVSNMLFHALMQRIDVYVGDTLITQSGGFYAWKAGIETMLNFGSDAKKSQLASIMYYKDGTGAENKGLLRRRELVKGSKSFELFGPLHIDLFFQQKYLINNVPLRIKINRSSPEFYMVNTSGEECKIEITEAVLWIRRVEVAASVELAHAKALLSGKNAVYAMRRGEVEVVSVPPHQQTVSKDNLFTSRLPKKLVIGLVKNDVFNGVESKHTFEFKHFGLENLEISVDGENVCGTPLHLDFNNQKYMRAYDGIFHAMNNSYADSGTDITYEDFAKGKALFCFDLTADGCGNNSNHFELTKQGNLRLKLHFATPLTETITVIVYGEFESVLEITNSREVLLDYKK